MQQLCAINKCTKKLHTSIENVSPFVDDFTEKMFSFNVPIRLIACVFEGHGKNLLTLSRGPNYVNRFGQRSQSVLEFPKVRF